MKYPGLLLFLVVVLCGCLNIKDKKTTLNIEDNNRHYYPILSGQTLDVAFTIKNTGAVPFVLSDMVISCGCITSNKSSIDAIPAGGEGRLILKYNTIKNVGYVKHYVTLYGNLLNKEKIDIWFDVNVVPDPLYTKDYEELHHEEMKNTGKVKEMVDGKASNKGYYLDGEF